jgi:hypothetical protein
LKAEGSSGGGGGSQTFQQVLTTGATMTGNNTVALGGNNFAFSATSTDPVTINGNVNGESRFLETNANNAGGASHYWQNDRLSYSANYAGVYMGGSAAAGSFLGLPLADGFFLFSNGTNASGIGIGTATAKPVVLATNNTARITISSAGALKFGAYGSGSNTGTVAYNLGVDASGNVIETTSGTTTSGTYTPTLVGSANVTGTPSVTQATYIQSGNIVTVRVSGLVTPTAVPTITIFTISLPFTTATTTQVGVVSGSVTTQSSTPYYAAAFGGVIFGSTVDVRYLADANAGSTNAYSITFQYKTN